MVESDGDIKGELVEASGYKFLVSDQVANYAPRMGDITIDFLSQGYQKGFLVYFSD